MATLKVNSTTWQEIPQTAFYGQNQSTVDMRLKKSETTPTSQYEGLEVPPIYTFDTDSAPSGTGKYFIKAEHGEDHDFYYEEII